MQMDNITITLINNKLTELRLELGQNLDMINDHNTRIYELKLHNAEIEMKIKELEDAAIILKGNEFLRSKRNE